MTRSWRKYRTGKAVWDKGPSRLASASTPPCILPPFLLLFLFALLRILVLPAERSSAPLSLNKEELKTLINKYPRGWYAMKGPGMKKMLQFKPFCWHSGLFDKCVFSLQKMLMIVLNILSTVRKQKKLLSIDPSAVWEKLHKYFSQKYA